jgi:hypothetical protein
MNINHDTLNAGASVSNALPQPRAFYWDFDGNGTWDDSSVINTTSASIQAAIDDYTLSGPEKMYVMVVDDSGMSVSDTVDYTVGTDVPVAHAGNDTGITIGSSLDLHGSYTQAYGYVTRWEWKIGNGAYIVSSGPDTTITPPSRYDPAYPCVLRVTDDRGSIDEDTIMVTVGIRWEVVGGGPVSEDTCSFYSLAVDFTYAPYLAFTDILDTSLLYQNRVFVKKFNGSAWESVGGPVSPVAVESVDLAVGSGWGGGGGGTVQYGAYFVAYKERYTPGQIRVKRLSGSNWVTQGDSSDINGTGYYDLECGATSVYPSIAYRDSDNSGTGIVKYLDYSYLWATRGSYLASSWYDDIALSTGGTAVYYENLGTDRLSIYSAGWTHHTISGFAPGWADMIDATQYGTTEVYLSYSDGTQSDKASVRVFNGSTWNYAGTPGFSTGNVVHTELAVDPDTRNIFVAYHDYGNSGRISVKHFDGSDWITVGQEGFTPPMAYTFTPSVAARNGKVYIAFVSDTDRRVTVMELK